MHPTTAPIRLALIGCGAAARACHLPALATVAGGQLTAVIDPVPERAHEAIALLDELIPTGPGARPAAVITAHTHLDDALPAFDAAIVVTPHATHSSIGAALLGAGKHVLMEKPLATSGDEAQALRAAVQSHPGLVFAMAQPRRLFPAYVWARDLIASGRLGPLRRIRWLEGGAYGWEPFSGTMFERDLAGGGVLIDSASHIFDTLAWWLGGSLAITGYSDNCLGGVESDAVAWLRHGDTEVTVELSRIRELGTSCEIQGEDATATIGTDFPAGECSLLSADGSVQFRGEVAAVSPARDTWEGLFEEQIEDFCRAVRSGGTPYASVADGVTALDLISDCYQRERGTFTMPWIESGSK